MADERPPIPRQLRREVLFEAGHRCAIPTCKQVPVEIAHIVPWSQIGEHTFDNLIALCPTCHTRYDRGDIDRQSMFMYKRNLGLITSRYGEAERRLLDLFVRTSAGTAAQFDRAMDFEFMYLLQDGLLAKIAQQGGVFMSGVRQGPEQYALTETGVQFVNHLREGSAVENTEQPE